MATIKSYTTIEQSRKLAEILPLESADMVYTITNGYHTPWIRIEKINELDKDDICAWSLGALLDVLPTKLQIVLAINDFLGNKKEKYAIASVKDKKYDCFADNPIDACVEMIIKLHELNML